MHMAQLDHMLPVVYFKYKLFILLNMFLKYGTIGLNLLN